MSHTEPSTRADDLKFLQVALEEAQATVRAYDTKAQIVGIGYTFALNIVAVVVGGLPGASGGEPLYILLFWLIVMAPLFLFGYVLYPSRRLAPQVKAGTEVVLRRVLYVETARHKTVEDLQSAVHGSDWVSELSFELLKVSKLRELKRGRFVRALIATCVSFGMLALLQLWTAL
ncbi:hypothetical protein C1J03_03230 [Sulfitobacter sp. SK012]|uniref:hypothetical protein n=1 Tax=Sulfitobacter sp. SK012 TaxID=1389005 RepID=UPI000E0B13FC|nr:hypothetical protein [Sulfitobacter sp. SK012]AXI45134.1 hypothetical protein C1J03_03230 [Sulfitobacter sp. SK012]